MTDHHHKSTSSEWHPSLHTMAQVALAIQHTKSWQPRAASPSPSPSRDSSPASSAHTSPSIPQGPFSPHSPAGRRYSWTTEDRKHACQMHGVAGIGECPGFTEHSPAQKKNHHQQQQPQQSQQSQDSKGSKDSQQQETPKQNNTNQEKSS